MLKKKISPEQANKVVISIVNDFNSLSKKRLAGISPCYTWLLYSRALNYLFRDHYMLAMGFGNKEMAKKESTK